MPSDVVRIMCPKLTCKRLLVVPESSRGRNVRCKNCGTTVRVPDRAAAAPGQAAPAAPGAPSAATGEEAQKQSA